MYVYNQVGYHPTDAKIAYVMANQPLEQPFTLSAAGGQNPQVVKSHKIQSGIWGQYEYHYLLDFSGYYQPGTYDIHYKGEKLATFSVGHHLYEPYQDDLLSFMRQ